MTKSLTNVIDYIADVIAERVSSQTPHIQDGFSSVNQAAETMASIGGSKFNKTRHFRITKKNKTRHR
jgi:hypothetical protein